MTEQAYKTCPKCGVTSLDAEFANTGANYCRVCWNSYQSTLNALRKKHPYPVDHRCDICGKSEDELPASFGSMGVGIKGKAKRITPWRLDHCHESGEFRGFLCHSCNSGLGKFKDDPDILMKAVAYLEGHKQKAAMRAKA